MLGLNERIYERIRNSILWAVGLLTISFGAALLLLEFESFNPGANIKTLGDLYWWWLTTITSLGSEFSPITPEGRAIATGVMFIGFILLGLTISELSAIIKMVYARKEEGNIKITYKNHIVIFGYTSLTAGVIKLLRNNFGGKLQIVLISNDIEFNPFPGLVDFINDNPINKNTLTTANIGGATAAIILANDRFRDPDTYSLAIASGIEAENNKAITIAEIVDDNTRSLFKMTNVEGFINRRELLEDLLANNHQPKLVRIISKETILDPKTEMKRSDGPAELI